MVAAELRRWSPWVLLTVVGCGAVGQDGPPVNGSSGFAEPLGHPEARITFVNPWARLPDGSETGSMDIYIDGSSVGDCKKSERDKAVVCVDKASVSPGRHFITMTIYQLIPTQSYRYHREDVVFVNAFDDVTYDISRASSKDQAAYIHRENVVRIPSACERDLFTLVSAPACTAGELTAILPRLAQAKSDCRSAGAGVRARAETELALVSDSALSARVERCFTPDQLDSTKHGSLPPLFTASVAGERWWPAGTLHTGSWAWARDVLPPPPDIRAPQVQKTLEGSFDELSATLLRAIERVAVLDDFPGPWMADALPLAAIDKAIRGPFDLDPRTPAGHRLNLLLRRGFPSSKSPDYDERLARYLMASMQSARGLSCDRSSREQASVADYILGNDVITEDKWRSIQALIMQTPVNAEPCLSPLGDGLTGVPSQYDRFRWFTWWDCQPSRDPRVRGQVAKSWLRDDNRHVSADLRARIRSEFASCLGTP